MVSIGQYIIHRTRHTVLIATSSSQMVVTLSSMYQVIPTNMPPSYKPINIITQLYVYAWNNSVVIILVGTDGHGHENSHQHRHTNPKSKSIVIISSYVATPLYITINNSSRRRRREARCVINCRTVLID